MPWRRTTLKRLCTLEYSDEREVECKKRQFVETLGVVTRNRLKYQLIDNDVISAFPRTIKKEEVNGDVNRATQPLQALAKHVARNIL